MRRLCDEPDGGVVARGGRFSTPSPSLRSGTSPARGRKEGLDLGSFFSSPWRGKWVRRLCDEPDGGVVARGCFLYPIPLAALGYFLVFSSPWRGKWVRRLCDEPDGGVVARGGGFSTPSPSLRSGTSPARGRKEGLDLGSFLASGGSCLFFPLEGEVGEEALRRTRWGCGREGGFSTPSTSARSSPRPLPLLGEGKRPHPPRCARVLPLRGEGKRGSTSVRAPRPLPSVSTFGVLSCQTASSVAFRLAERAPWGSDAVWSMFAVRSGVIA